MTLRIAARANECVPSGLAVLWKRKFFVTKVS
jgi:hypothetical protein